MENVGFAVDRQGIADYGEMLTAQMEDASVTLMDISVKHKAPRQ